LTFQMSEGWADNDTKYSILSIFGTPQNIDIGKHYW